MKFSGVVSLRWAVWCFALSCFGLVLPSTAQWFPAGDEWQVNGYTTGSQIASDVAADASGNFVVVWTSDGSSGSDTSGSSIQGQRFDSSGQPLGSEFQVNSHTERFQVGATVAMHPDGRFVVAWGSHTSAGNDLSYRSRQARLFDVAGTPIGEDFQVNTYTTQRQYGAKLAMDAAGDFVVVWESRGSAGSDTSFSSVQARRFNSSGAPLGDDFQVNTYTPDYQSSPSLAMDEDGSFIVLWYRFGNTFVDLYGQRFDSGGGPLGQEFLVNDFTTGFQTRSAVAMDGQGGFVVAWQSFVSAGTDDSNYSIQALRFDASGLPQGDQVQVNTYTLFDQTRPSIHVEPSGDFLIVWQSRGSSGSDGDGRSIQGQGFASSGAPLGGEFQINSHTPADQSYPQMAPLGQGRFVVTWSGGSSSGSDNSYFSVQGRLLNQGQLFEDGFESGDLTSWDGAAP